NRYNTNRAAPLYAAELKKLNLDFAQDDPQLSARLRGLRLRLPIAAALHHWAAVTSDMPLRARLLRVAREADPDPWRDRLCDPAQAAAYWRAGLSIRPDSLASYNNLGVSLAEENKLEEAIATYHKALALNPHFANLHNNLGNALSKQKKLDAAIAAYRQAIAL